MYVSKNTTILLAALGIAALSTAASAQFGNSTSAIRWFNVITQTQQNNHRPVVQFQSIEFGDQSHTFVVLLNQTQGRTGLGFQDMPRGNDDFGFRNSNRRDIDAHSFARPKDDGLSIVPLPPAAFAGLGVLAGIAGIRALRRSNR